ncbi:hypothetical protein SEUCBS140593_002012 [Sporothrix eucalyptigena]|uniref:Uncharacterized protein n=1 Tax=Sporothrix eucalyptigena TaxID=1812306 RepID=A0ABP0B3P6_9PEZI
MAYPAPNGPFRLVTVNTAPERAKRLIGIVVEKLKDRYTIEHVANCDNMEDVEAIVKAVQPNVLCCASMWTPEESMSIRVTAKSIIPGIKTHAIPQGLQVQRGPEAIVEHLCEELPKLLDQ